MSFIFAITLTATSAIAAGNLIGGAHAADTPPGWSYNGEYGPANWGQKDKANRACRAGKRQSPINLKKSKPQNTREIKLNWSGAKMNVANDGNLVRVTVPSGNTTTYGKLEYALESVEFHHKSEHAINGKHFPIEAQYIHNAVDGKRLIMSVMYAGNKHNAALGKIWQVAPKVKAERESKRLIELWKLVPEKADYFQYSGSLTTPPCTENVIWVVFNKSLKVSKKQVKQMDDVFPANIRPLQDLNDRKVNFGN